MNFANHHSLRIALGQLDPVLGDFEGNAGKILAAIGQARSAGAELLVVPELALSGQPVDDFLRHAEFHAACTQQLERIRSESSGICVIVGHPLQEDGACFNAASVFADGKLLAVCRKQKLAVAGVLDEQRYYRAGRANTVFSWKGVRLGLLIGADACDPVVVERFVAAGAEAVLVIDATPYHMGQRQAWLQAWDKLRRRCGDLPVLSCNLAGAQDELVFAGASFALDRDGRLAFRAPSFEPTFALVDYERGRWRGEVRPLPASLEAEVYAALQSGVRGFFAKNGFPGAIIGLSGGIDSALVLAIAVDALGAERVRAVMMASPYTAQMSFDDARDMARRLGVRYDEIPILPAMEAFSRMLAEPFAGLDADVTEENLQSRIRGTTLMALSNKTGDVVLITSNKSEMATGYSTLYGDMAGALAVLKDVDKTMVYRLSNWRNSVSEVIPPNIIARPPSAELRPEQVDADSLPPYEVLDAVVAAYVEEKKSVGEIIAAGWPEDEVRRIVAMIRRNEYKRRQAPIGLRITSCAFGREWHYPITARFPELPRAEDSQ